MKRKVLSALLSVAMVATLLVGCGSKTEEATPAAEPAAKIRAYGSIAYGVSFLPTS